MEFFKRLLQRIGIIIVSLLAIWVIVIQIFERLEDRMPLFLALALTYFVTAYLFLPRLIRLSLIIFRNNHIPCCTRAGDNLLADPVNIVLIGSETDLVNAFEKAQWHTAEPLNIKNSLKMIEKYISKRPYDEAPFSALYLFGKRQDHGFQQAIDNSPRHRHHIRFWATNDDMEKNILQAKYWTTKQNIDKEKSTVWVGAGTKDIGIGLKRLTYQITHATDKNIDEERDHIIASLRQAGVIENETFLNPGQLVNKKYISDGRILVATLKK